MTKRIHWVDISRAIAIFIVVVLHFGTWNKLDSFAHLFHMPVFYIISGFCYNRKSTKEFFASRLKSLIVPYLFISILLYTFWTVVQMGNSVSVNNWLYHLLWMNTEAVPNLYGCVQWFLTSLFFVEVFYYFVDYCHEQKIVKSSLVVAIVIIGFVISFFKIRLPLALDTAFVMLFFYYTGSILKETKLLDKIQKFSGGVLSCTY